MSADQYSTPDKAEAAFYEAFQRGDLHAMMDVWSDDEGIVCIHPGAPRLQGQEQVREGWRQILENSTGLQFVLNGFWRGHFGVHQNKRLATIFSYFSKHRTFSTQFNQGIGILKGLFG